jgi:hypothetical protein
MTEDSTRTAATRDVPPPRPVAPPGAPVPAEETGLGRAARAVAEAVAGLIGSGSPDGTSAAADRRRAAAAGLRDVIGAVAGAVGGAFAPGREDGVSAPSAGPVADAPATSRSPGAVLGDLLSAAAPRLPIRDAVRLREAYPGASDDEIADALVARAARLTSGIGAAVGGLSAAHWFAPASLLALPLELGAETVLIGAVEVVLIGELHELHGRPASGDAGARASAYLASWSAQRSVDSAGGLGSLLGTAGIRELRRRVTRKLAGTAAGSAPLLLGAAVSSRVNRRATESLAARVLDDLRTERPTGPDGPAG